MKIRPKKSSKLTLSDKISDALTVKPKADIEDDHVFGTKPTTVSRADFSSSDSEDDAAISDFRKRNVNLLSEISKKYEGAVVYSKDLEEHGSNDGYEESDSEEGSTKLSAQNLSLDNDESSQDGEESKIEQLAKLMRKNLDDSDESGSDAESEDYSIMNKSKKSSQTEDSESDNDGEDDDGEDDDGEDDDGEDDDGGYDISQLEEPLKEDFQHVKKQNVSEEAKKGTCVRNQLLIWEGLLEMRIHLQRCITTANQMPLPDTHEELKHNNEFAEECNATRANITNVLDKFLTLQNLLFKNFPDTKKLSSNKKIENETQKSKSEEKEDSDEEIPSDTDNEEIPSDTEPEDNGSDKEQDTKKPGTKTPQAKKRKLEDYEQEISTSHKVFKPFRDSTIQKWNEKTRLATANNIKNAPTNTVLQQISYILSDREKLVRRTQLKRSEYDIVGYKNPATENDNQNNSDSNQIKGRKDDDEYIPEIFDDSDFYHQLLRELIECKTADISDPVQLSRQWIALQQMRSKMKRKVDTKATKGRKIKYVVHNQLVNYMAPEKCTTWTDESTSELYNSLFGKIFEHNNVGLNSNLEKGFKIKK